MFNETSFSVAVGPRLVKTTADSGVDSLRQHVLDAEAGDLIGFDSSFNSPKTITLSTFQIKLDKALSIDGTGKAVTIDANKISRHFEIAPSIIGPTLKSQFLLLPLSMAAQIQVSHALAKPHHVVAASSYKLQLV